MRPTPPPDERYQLGTVPRRLRRRVDAVMTVSFVGFGIVFLVGVAVIEGMRPNASVWLVISGCVAVGIGTVAWILRTLSPEDRAVIQRASRRSLPSLPRADVDPVLEVPLRPGFFWRRRLADRQDLLVLTSDGNGLTIPAWLFEPAPRAPDRFTVRLLAWPDITGFRVQADSDGPDLYVIEVKSAGDHPVRWRVRRREVTDEVALLDHVRSVGALTVELEASVPPA